MPTPNNAEYVKFNNAVRALYKCEEGASKSTEMSCYVFKENLGYDLQHIFAKYQTLLKFMKSEDFGTYEFGGKHTAILIAYKYNKLDIMHKFADEIKKDEADKAAAIKAFEEQRVKEAKQKRDDEIQAVKMIVPDIHLLNYTATINMNKSPWATLKLDLNYDEAIHFENCPDGIYVVKNNLTLYFGTSRHGTYYCNLTTFEKKDNKINILLSHSFYSGLTGIGYGKVDGFQEFEQSNDKSSIIIPYSTFMQNNKKVLAEFVAVHVDLLDKPRKQELIYSDN